MHFSSLKCYFPLQAGNSLLYLKREINGLLASHFKMRKIGRNWLMGVVSLQITYILIIMLFKNKPH